VSRSIARLLHLTRKLAIRGTISKSRPKRTALICAAQWFLFSSAQSFFAQPAQHLIVSLEVRELNSEEEEAIDK
jgi:hypothetical protein